MVKDEVEAVAKAFYCVQDDARGWDREAEVLKERFRRDARAAIEALDEHREAIASRRIKPLVVAKELGSARDLLMNAHEISVLSVPAFRSFRTVLQGPEFTFVSANDAYFKLVGGRELLGLPVREALPELRGQGYFELLAHVYQSKEAFVGRQLPIMFQPKPGAVLEQHIIDFVYRPIEDATGQVTGLFVEGYDRTEWARS